MFALFIIQSGFAGAEWHINSHSGYSPISTKLPTLLTMGGVLIYTAMLILTLGGIRTVKSMEARKDLA